MAEECPVCINAYTKQYRKRVECGYCGVACCSACLQQYVLTLQGDPHCMGCKRRMDGEFLASHLPRTFMLGRYKEHRERVLLEREKALLPASQDLLQNYRTAQGLRESLGDLDRERRQLLQRVYELNTEMAGVKNRAEAIERSQYTVGDNTAHGGTATERRQFVRACPMDGCRGFLSTAWRCGTCETWVCKDCGEPKLNGQRDEEHRCDPAAAASHALLQKDSRPCPQCASMIFKVDGCFGAGVAVRLWGGGTKPAEHIQEGDTLVGDDGQPRRVVRTMRGEDEMFRVHQWPGEPYTVSSRHLLVLTFLGELFEMTVHDFLHATPPRHRALLRGVGPGGEEREIAVLSQGRGRYYGWEVEGPGEVEATSLRRTDSAHLCAGPSPSPSSRRFLLADGTVVHNCDQMWCTQCHVAFSWRTGQVVTNGVVHNPHYYAWVRSRNDGRVPRNPGDVPCGGDALPSIYTVDGFLRRHPSELRTAEGQELRGLHRAVRHTVNVELPRLRAEAAQGGEAEERRNADLRLKYLLRQIDDQEWKTKLQQREKRRERAFAVTQVYDMFCATATDAFRGMVDGVLDPGQALAELQQLRRFANDSLDAIAKRFNMAAKRL